MFTREKTKNKVDPGGTKRNRKSQKPAWETLFNTQAKDQQRQIAEKVRFWKERAMHSEDDESDDDYDSSPNRAYNLSASMPRGQERQWTNARGTRQNDKLSRSWGPNSFQHSKDFQHSNGLQRSNGFQHSNGFLNSTEMYNSNEFSQSNGGLDGIWTSKTRGSPSRGEVTIEGDFQLYPGYPPIPQCLVSKIQKGQYVNFQEMLPDNLINSTTVTKRLKDETDRVSDVTKWIDCMANYIAIVTLSRPERLRDLLIYQSHVMRLIRDSHDKTSWQRYDVAFRRKAAQSGMLNWSNVDENLWIMACSADARKSVTCKPCLSIMHDFRTCPIDAMNKEENAKTNKKNAWGIRSKSPNRDTHNRTRSLSPTRASVLPKDGLELQFAFGYHGYNACNNVFYTQANEMVFHVAALGIVYSPLTHKQRFYKGHSDDILCLTIHDFKDYVATGQVGRLAETHVWDTESMRLVARLKGVHKRGVICVDFSGDGKKLADVGLDDDHLICVWDWRKEEKLATTRGHKDMIFVLEWNPFNPNHLVSVGEKHIKFWTHNNNKIEKRPVTFGKAGTAATMLCVCHSAIDDLCFSGSDNGTVYVWQGTTLRRTVQAHKGAVCAMYSISQSKNEGFVTGGRDGVVVMWDKYFEQCLKAFKVENSVMNPGSVLLQDLPPIRAIHTDEDKILIGTGNDEIIEIGTDGMMTIWVQGHGEGEVWGLDTHPTENECVTVSDDKTLRVWDLNTHLLKQVKKMKKGGRAVAYSPDGGSLAVGQNDGGFLILEATSLEKVVGYKDRKEEISDIKFSPDGKFLAVGSHDNFVDVYSVKRGKRTGVCKGSSSYITHLDWDVKGRLLQTNSGAREHLFYEAPHCRRQTLTNHDMERIDWSTFTCVLGPMVKGVYPPMTDVTDVNSTARSHDQVLLASGDDFGMVKLFNYPVSQRGARFRQYNGHSSHVTNVRWTHDDRFLVSTGGLDTGLLVWERVRIEEDEEAAVPEDKVFVQPKFLPTGPIKDPIAKGKPQFD